MSKLALEIMTKKGKEVPPILVQTTANSFEA